VLRVHRAHFFLDRFRFPFFILFAAATYLLWLPQPCDHFYAVIREAHKQGPYPAEILSAKGRKDRGSLIVVCANGGGIQASAWTKVLTDLDGLNIGEFSRHVAAISAVSGWSEGAMFYVQAFEKGSLPYAAQLGVLNRSQKSSLDEVTWRLIGPDLARQIMPWWFRKSGRGWGLERSWEKRGMGDITMGTWRDDLRKGDRPAVMFNSTVVETGERMIFSNFDFVLDSRDRDSRERKAPRFFNEIYGDYDLRVSTAVRLSATFPPVTPVAEPRPISADNPPSIWLMGDITITSA
jgi:hypothetical protein